MKTKMTICALALLATVFATEASAEAQQVRTYRTTVQQLGDAAEVIVAARLDRVESIQLAEVGIDAARHKRVNDGSRQDGEDNVRREGVLKINTVLKGTATVGDELRFVSIRQLKFAAYDEDLRTGEVIYFLSRRSEDSRYVVLAEERGTVSAAETNGDLNAAMTFIKDHLAEGSTNEAGIDRMLDTITLDGSRLSQDNCYDLSWRHEEFAPAMNETQRQRIMTLCKLSESASVERNQLLTAVGRHKPEGALQGLLEVMLGDANWSTTSLASMSLEYVDRGQAIVELIDLYADATDDTTKMVIVRSLGLIRPKADYDGVEVRNDTLQIVGDLLKAETDADLLREALIASRDLRAEDAHVDALKALIDGRETNGITDAELKGAIVALAAARRVWDSSHNGDSVAVLAKQYLVDLGETDPVLKQVVESALKFPYTVLIKGADGLGH